MSDLDEVSGVFDTIESESTAHDPIEEVSTEAVAEGTDSTADTTDAAQTQETEKVEETSEVAPVEGQAQNEAATTETAELSQQEESTEAEVDKWEETLPPPPAPYQGPQPEYNSDGQIINMTPDEYTRYMTEVAKAEFRQESYATVVENRALDVAEKILPAIKTNPAVRQMVENARVASILSGQQVSTVEAAKLVREALGIAPDALNAAKTEGAQNAKASITVQKNAALETGSAQVQTEDPSNDLIRRINRGDDDAFADLLGQWEKDGKI